MDAITEPFLPQIEHAPGKEYTIAPEHSEIVIAFVGAVGVNLSHAEEAVTAKLTEIGYQVIRIRVTTDVLPQLDAEASQNFPNDFSRIWKMMDIGTEARKKFGSDIVAFGIAAQIANKRPKQTAKTAYLVHTVKHPDEVRRLREIYSRGFYLIGVHSPPESRRKYLGSLRGIGRPEAKRLMDRDRKENREFGQQLVDTFHLSDFFSGWEENDDSKTREKSIQLLKNSINRFIEIMFGHPNRTPTFGEYAMFLAFSTALRSADLSRQVGAVIARNGEILGTGANDCPRAGGGLYWPILDQESLTFIDYPRGRDWTRSGDSNRKEQIDLVTQIVDIVGNEMSKEVSSHLLNSNVEADTVERLERGLLKKLRHVLLTNSRIADLTEYGRIVHAEMEAMLSCARTGISTVGATLYSTTFPCHNCAKHIIAAGIKRVVFIEPYLKSRAMKFHDEAIQIVYPVVSQHGGDGKNGESNQRVSFEPFFGVGPRKFFDLFSMDIGAGYRLVRKERPNGSIKSWRSSDAVVRVPMTRDSYIQREQSAADRFHNVLKPKISTEPKNAPH
jgi:deoxycytidylate deaminase